MFLIFDTETTGKIQNFSAPITETENFPRVVQIAWQLHDAMGNLIEHQDYLIAPEDYTIPYEAEVIHGISTEFAQKEGEKLDFVLQKFLEVLSKTTYIVGHNLSYDVLVMQAEFFRKGIENNLENLIVLDTCTEFTAELCQLPGGKGGGFKYPRLTELHEFLFGTPFVEAHNATADVEATTRCFFELFRIRRGFSLKILDELVTEEFLQKNPNPIVSIGLKHRNLKSASEALRKKNQTKNVGEVILSSEDEKRLEEAIFVHLHNHSQFSKLQATTSLPKLIKKTAEFGMPAVALTDLGNMMGAFQFVKEITSHNQQVLENNEKAEQEGLPPTEIPIKGIIGCEFFVCENHLDKKNKDNGYQMVFLAKNKNGYHNLVKMVSKSYTEGFYYEPRIDKEMIEEYHEDIIVLSGGVYGEIYGKILNLGERQAEDALLWWKNLFQDDFYLEIMRHGQEEENRANEVLVRFANKHNVKLVATNNSYYIEQSEANAHDILLCVKEGEKQKTPIGRGRGFRYGFPNQEYYFKSPQEMKKLFKDLPQAIFSIEEIVDKVENYKLERDVLLPKFDIPAEFQQEDDPDGKKGENKYLHFLTYKGAERVYGEITDLIRERIDFELSVIEKTGYPGYFLIVQDFIAEARKMGVGVGPGRGSAAGSVVAYCLGIISVDPIKYDLLFERFLNPERVSMPDIDIDFDDEGRAKVIEYVIDKYGANQVAQIITYGKMAAKSAVKDAGRVLDLPLHETNEISKFVPDKMSLATLFSASEEDIKKKLKSDELPGAFRLKELEKGESLAGKTLQQAKIIEGSLRNTGIHACGIIITPDDITNFVPVTTAKDSELWVTQFDNSVAESAGLLKMDFLGLKTLTLIRDTIQLIKQRHNLDLDPEKFPLDDPKTYELFQRGETVGTFQYESLGMQKYMRQLQPTTFEDLIAMNALYRPGPLEYIPKFIRRKLGKEVISYDLEDMEEFLKETYGVTVYQEQVMLLSQKLAGFTKGEADNLRKAMGKKQKDVLDKMKPKFISQAAEKGYDVQKLEKIWSDWEAFASYAFNKSHSTCYAWVGYQTAYLKANYPAEYMASVLSNNMRDIKSVQFFLEECNRMGLKVLPPDVNESYYKFSVNKNGDIRFGLGAIKNVGQGAVDTIILNRKESSYKSIFDLAKRVDLRAANKKAFESMALAGAFDSFGNIHRAQYFHISDNEQKNFIEKAISFGTKSQESEKSQQMSLFGEQEMSTISMPAIPVCKQWGTLEKLQREREVVGFYLSGHPLDDYKFEYQYLCNASEFDGKNLEEHINKEFSIAGLITKVELLENQKGEKWAKFILEDYDFVREFRIFSEDYKKFRLEIIEGEFIFLKMRIFLPPSYNPEKKSTPRVQYISISPLKEVLSKQISKVDILINLKELSLTLIESLKSLAQEHKGTKRMGFKLYEMEDVPILDEEFLPDNGDNENEDEISSEIEQDSEDKEEKSQENTPKKKKEDILKSNAIKKMLNMFSMNTKVTINNDFLNKLEQQNIDFRLS